MYIVCRDMFGMMINMKVNKTVFFIEGKACFTSDSEDMEVPIENIVKIGHE